MNVDGRAVGLGALAAIVIAFPSIVIGGVTSPPGAVVALLVLVVLIGFVVGGVVAGSKRPDAPFTHGLLAGAAACAVTSLLSIGIAAARGDDIVIAAYAFNVVLAAGCGCLGGLIAQRRAA